MLVPVPLKRRPLISEAPDSGTRRLADLREKDPTVLSHGLRGMAVPQKAAQEKHKSPAMGLTTPASYIHSYGYPKVLNCLATFDSLLA